MAEGPWEEYAAKPDTGLKPWEEYAPKSSRATMFPIVTAPTIKPLSTPKLKTAFDLTTESSTAPLPNITAPTVRPTSTPSQDFSRAMALPGITNPEKTAWEKTKEFVREPIIGNIAVEGGPPNIGSLEIGEGSWNTEPTTKRVRDVLAERGGGPVSGLSRGVGNIAAGLTSPENIGLMTGIGLLPKLGAAAAGAAFTGEQIRHLPEQIKGVYDTATSPDSTSGDVTQAVTELAGSTALGYLGAKGAVRDFRTSPQVKSYMAPRIASDFNAAQDLAYDLGGKRHSRPAAREMMQSATEGTTARMGQYGLTNPLPAPPDFSRDAPLVPLPVREALPPRASAPEPPRPVIESNPEIAAKLKEVEANTPVEPVVEPSPVAPTPHAAVEPAPVAVETAKPTPLSEWKDFTDPWHEGVYNQRWELPNGESYEIIPETYDGTYALKRTALDRHGELAEESLGNYGTFDKAVEIAEDNARTLYTDAELSQIASERASPSKKKSDVPVSTPVTSTAEAKPPTSDPRRETAVKLGLNPDKLNAFDNLILDDVLSPDKILQGRGMRRLKLRGEEAGSVPLTPNEKHVQEMVDRREAARRAMKGQTGSSLVHKIWYEGRDKAKGYAKDSINKIVERDMPILNVLDKIHKFDTKKNKDGTYSILPSQEFGKHRADMLRSGSLASELARRVGLIDAIQSPETIKEFEMFDQVMFAKHAAEIDALNEKKKAGLAQARADYKAARKAGDADAIVKANKQYDYFKKQKEIKLKRTPEQAAKDNLVAAEEGHRFVEHEKKVRAFVEAIEDIYTSSGIISHKAMDTLRKTYPNYMDFHRIMPLDEHHFAATRGAAHKSSTDVVQKMKGSEDYVIDSPIGNLLKKAEQAFAEASQNKAAATAAWYANLPGGKEMGLRPISAKAAEKMNMRDYFAYLEDGKPKYVQAPRDFVAAARTLNPEQMSTLTNAVLMSTRIFKAGTTGPFAPLFGAANVVKDQWTRWINHLPTGKLADKVHLAEKPSLASRVADLTGIHMGLARATLDALIGVTGNHVFGKSKHYDRMVANSGGGSSNDLYRENPVVSVRDIRDKRSGMARVKSLPRHLLREIENTMGMFEEFTRLQEFRLSEIEAKQHKMGARESAALAGKAGRETTTDFMRKGDWAKTLTVIQPYLNATIQGTRQSLHAMRKDPAGYATRVAMISIPIAITTLYNLSDPKRKEAYDDISEWEKKKNLFILSDQPKDEQGRYSGYKFPLPPGVDEVTRLVSRMVEQEYGGDPLKAKEVLGAIFGYFSPVSGTWDQIVGQMVPQPVRGEVEVMANKKFFEGSPIVSSRMAKKPVSERRFDWTTGTAQMIGDATGTAPVQVDHILKSHFGAATPQLLRHIDVARKTAADAIPGDNKVLNYLRDVPVGGESYQAGIGKRFFSAKGGAVDEREMAKTDEAEAIAAAENAPEEKIINMLFNLWKKDPDEMRKKGMELDDQISDAAHEKLMRMIEIEQSDLKPWEKDLKHKDITTRAVRIIGMAKGKAEAEKHAIYDDMAEKGILTESVWEKIKELDARNNQ